MDFRKNSSTECMLLEPVSALDAPKSGEIGILKDPVSGVRRLFPHEKNLRDVLLSFAPLILGSTTTFWRRGSPSRAGGVASVSDER